MVCHIIFKCIKNVIHGENCSESNVLPAVYPNRVATILLSCTQWQITEWQLKKKKKIYLFLLCIWDCPICIRTWNHCPRLCRVTWGCKRSGDTLESKIYQSSFSQLWGIWRLRPYIPPHSWEKSANQKWVTIKHKKHF